MFSVILRKRIKSAKRELEACRRSPLSCNAVAREQILRYKLERLEDQRDLYWRQRAKTHWLQHGGRNTNFFHHFSSERRKRSRIKILVKEDGEVVTDTAGIHELVTNYCPMQVIDIMSCLSKSPLKLHRI